MLWKTASEFGEDTTSMVDWVRNFPWDYMSTASTRALLNTFTPLPIANYLIAYSTYADTLDLHFSDVRGECARYYSTSTYVYNQSAVSNYEIRCDLHLNSIPLSTNVFIAYHSAHKSITHEIQTLIPIHPLHQTVPLQHSKPSYTMSSASIVRLLDIATNNSCDYNGLSTEALQSVLQQSNYEHPTTILNTATTVPCYDGSFNNFQRPMMTWPCRFNYISREALTTYSYEQNFIGLSLHDVQALSPWIIQFNFDIALSSAWESTISSATIFIKSVMLQCHGGRHAHPPYVHEILRPNDRTNHVYNDIIGLNELVHEHYPISPVNDDVLSASASPNYVTYATYANNFITPSIVTTMTSLVFYFYEFNELSTSLSMIIAFTIMAAACVLRLLVARIQITEMPR